MLGVGKWYVLEKNSPVLQYFFLHCEVNILKAVAINVLVRARSPPVPMDLLSRLTNTNRPPQNEVIVETKEKCWNTIWTNSLQTGGSNEKLPCAYLSLIVSISKNADKVNLVPLYVVLAQLSMVDQLSVDLMISLLGVKGSIIEAETHWVCDSINITTLHWVKRKYCQRVILSTLQFYQR